MTYERGQKKKKKQKPFPANFVSYFCFLKSVFKKKKKLER
jgi:hypothetical protein